MKRLFQIAFLVSLTLFFAASLRAQNGTAPTYQSTTSTANPGTISALFTGTLGQNSTGFDTTYNPSPMDCYTRVTDALTLNGASVGNNTSSGGSNDVMWSKNATYLGFAFGGDTYILHLNTTGNCAQVINTGRISGGSAFGISVSNPFAFSRVTDTVFYNVVSTSQIWKNTITSDKTITSTEVIDLLTCPQFAGITSFTSSGILGVNDTDTRFALPLSVAGGQNSATFSAVYDRTSGCATMDTAPPSSDWQASHAYSNSPRQSFITPVLNNSGGYTYELKTPGTTGSTEPNPWNQTVSGPQSDGSAGWVNVGIAGQYYAFGASTPTGTLATLTTCTTGANCSCWGGAIHDGQLSGDGNFTVLSSADSGPPWNQGACASMTLTSFIMWSVGTATTQPCSTMVSGAADNCGGHNSIGTSKSLNEQSSGAVDSTRALSNTLTFSQYQRGTLWSTHGWWPQPDNGDDYPWIFTSYGLLPTGQDSGCGQPGHCPIAGGNSIMAVYPSNTAAYPPGQARTYFGHTYSCDDPTENVCHVPSGANWTASMSYTVNPTVTIITPTSGNAGNYSFEATATGTAGGSPPTWCQSAGCTVSDNGETLVNIGKAGSQANDFYFGSQFGILSGSQDGNWIAVSSGMLLSLGLDSSNEPRNDVFVVHIGAPVGVTAPTGLVISQPGEKRK